MVGAKGDEIPIHRPVVVFAEGEAVGGVVVAGYGEGNEVGGRILGARLRRGRGLMIRIRQGYTRHKIWEQREG